MQLFVITRTTINKGNSLGKIPLPLNLNKPFKSRERSSDARMSAVAAAVGAERGLVRYFL